ncbi:hypothetical protein QR665_19095 [Acinetobacter gerneri]|uniref:hypothetical protein n=1 Tax=Acinetobacter gerneri TaxID=202952 RepID=UPI00293575CF|nr:hypothetical protein [Acinetobacter gerneri]MDV2441549.1 hypothetical protein [Acinetobacter gerneri]
MSRYSHLTTLKQAYKDEKLMLFLGAGISTVLDLPNWSDLIKILAEDCEYERWSHLFEQLKAYL